jgi:hypothetical protein
VSKDDVPQAREAIDVLVTVSVNEHRAAAANPHVAGSMNGGIVLRVDQRGEVAREEFLRDHFNSTWISSAVRSPTFSSHASWHPSRRSRRPLEDCR